MPANCNCGRTWTGLSQAHCTICHEHFSTVANFDRHKPSRSGCMNPSTIVNRRTGKPVLKLSPGPLGGTWVGYGEYVGPANDADPAIGAA